MSKLPDGWENTTLGEFITLQRGYDLPEHQRRYGNVPVIGSSGLTGWHDVANVSGPGVTLGRSGNSFGVATYVAQDFWAHNTTMFVKDFHGNDVLFVFYFLDYCDFDKYNSGGAQPSLNRNFIYPIRIIIPPLAEQRKIAEILSTWDEAIQLVEALIVALKERKRGLMQRLLTGEVRFPGFDGEWEEVRLGDVFSRITRTVDDTTENVLSITAGVGFVDQSEKFGRVIAGKNLERYINLRHGEFAYNKGNSTLYPQGCIYRLEEYEEGAVPNVYYCFAPSTEEIIGDFYRHYFESGALNGKLRPLINSGVRNDGLLNLSADAFFSIEVVVPSPSEQHKMASFFDMVTDEIRIQQAYLNDLREQKKGLMQRLLTGEVRVDVSDDV